MPHLSDIVGHNKTLKDTVTVPSPFKHTLILLTPRTPGMDDLNNAGKDPQPGKAHALVDGN